MYAHRGLAGSDRITVQSLEEQVRSQSRRRRRKSSRLRRRSRDEPTLGKYLWLVVVLAVLLYLGFLATKIVWPKIASRLAPSGQGVETPVSEVAEAEEIITADELSPGGIVLPPAASMVAGLIRSMELAEEARRLVRSRQYTAAETKFEEAVMLTPNVHNLLVDWADVLRVLNRWSEVRDVMLRALSIEPASVPDRLALAEAYVALKQTEDALALALWVIRDESYSSAAHRIAAEAWTSMGEHEKALAHWEKLVSLDWDDNTSENNLGFAYLELNQNAKALKTFQNVILDEPGNSQAHYYLVLCLVRNNELDLAVDALSKAETLFGRQFVRAWTQSPEFLPLRENESFRQRFPEETDGAGLEP